MKITSSRILPIKLYIPAPAFGDGDGPHGDGTMDRVAGEALPDFSSLGAAEEKEPEKVTEQPAEPEVKEAEKADEPKSEPVDEIKEKTHPAKVEEPKKADEEKPPEFKPPTDEELDGITAMPTAPRHVKKGIADLKGIVKASRQHVEKLDGELKAIREEKARIEAEAAELRKRAESTDIPDEVKAELEEAREELRMLRLEKDPDIQRALDEGLIAKEDEIYKFLESKRLKPEIIEKIKASGFDKWTGWNALAKQIEGLGFQTKHEFEELLRERRGVIKNHEKTLTELKTKRDGLEQFRGQRETAEREQFAQKFTGEVQKAIATTHKWMELKKVPAGATPEQKAEIEAGNKRIMDMVEEFKPTMKAIYDRGPDVTAKVVLDALQARRMREEAVEKDAKIEAVRQEADKHKARVAELEAMLAKIKNAGKMDSSIQEPSKPAEIERRKIASDGTVKPEFPWSK